LPFPVSRLLGPSFFRPCCFCNFYNCLPTWSSIPSPSPAQFPPNSLSPASPFVAHFSPLVSHSLHSCTLPQSTDPPPWNSSIFAIQRQNADRSIPGLCPLLAQRIARPPSLSASEEFYLSSSSLPPSLFSGRTATPHALLSLESLTIYSHLTGRPKSSFQPSSRTTRDPRVTRPLFPRQEQRRSAWITLASPASCPS
jgi:hypothetical protein